MSRSDISDVITIRRGAGYRTKTVVLFSNLRARQQVYKGRTKLKGSGIWVNEDLIHSRAALNFQARQLYRQGGLMKNWTFLGEVYVRICEHDDPIKVHSAKELEHLSHQQSTINRNETN